MNEYRKTNFKCEECKNFVARRFVNFRFEKCAMNCRNDNISDYYSASNNTIYSFCKNYEKEEDNE